LSLELRRRGVGSSSVSVLVRSSRRWISGSLAPLRRARRNAVAAVW
jgi:hypothetical protein